MGLIDDIDFERLRLRLPGDARSGANLDEQGEARTRWQKIRELSEDARLLERKADQPTMDGEKQHTLADSLPLWRTIGQGSLEIINNVSHDLRVTQQLILALVRTDGFAGLAAGCRVARALVETQWPVLGPFPEQGEPDAPEEIRVQPLVALAGGDRAGVLENPILHVPLLAECAWGRFGVAFLPDGKLVDAKKEEEFRGVQEATTPDFFKAIHSQVEEAITEWGALADAVFAAAEGRVSLPRGPVSELLTKCRTAIRQLAGDLFGDPEPSDAPDTHTAENSSDAGPSTPVPRGGLVGKLSTRDDALQSLERVARFFEQQDPHSLLSAQIRYVVRMARMKQEDYFRELIRDKSALEQLSRFVGLDFGSSKQDSADA